MDSFKVFFYDGFFNKRPFFVSLLCRCGYSYLSRWLRYCKQFGGSEHLRGHVANGQLPLVAYADWTGCTSKPSVLDGISSYIQSDVLDDVFISGVHHLSVSAHNVVPLCRTYHVVWNGGPPCHCPAAKSYSLHHEQQCTLNNSKLSVGQASTSPTEWLSTLDLF